MEYKAMVEKNKYGYFIKLKDLSEKQQDKNSDFFVTSALNINLNYYQNYLIDNYNGFFVQSSRLSREVYFKIKKNAEKASQWVESLLIAAKLAE